MEDFGTTVLGIVVVIVVAALSACAVVTVYHLVTINACEAELPRNQQCILIAVPAVPMEAP